LEPVRELGHAIPILGQASTSLERVLEKKYIIEFHPHYAHLMEFSVDKIFSDKRPALRSAGHPARRIPPKMRVRVKEP
jgi:hypothetical protein